MESADVGLRGTGMGLLVAVCATKAIDGAGWRVWKTGTFCERPRVAVGTQSNG
jgi:hypothetical protein